MAKAPAFAEAFAGRWRIAGFVGYMPYTMAAAQS